MYYENEGSDHMNDNKQILKYCPNYYKIINFNPMSGDELSTRIINMYKDYIFKININCEEEVNQIKELDSAINKYINDFSFRSEIERQIKTTKIKNDCKDIIKFLVDLILKVFAQYEDYTTRVIYISRWI